MAPNDNGKLKVRNEQLAVDRRDVAEVRQDITDDYGMIAHIDSRMMAMG